MTGIDPKNRMGTDDRAADLRAEAFQGVRAARSRELAEDYVELIAELIHDHGEARPVDIAARLGVRVPTVTKTLDRLAREGLITRARYRSVFLTDEGRALANVIDVAAVEVPPAPAPRRARQAPGGLVSSEQVGGGLATE